MDALGLELEALVNGGPVRAGRGVYVLPADGGGGVALLGVEAVKLLGERRQRPAGVDECPFDPDGPTTAVICAGHEYPSSVCFLSEAEAAAWHLEDVRHDVRRHEQALARLMRRERALLEQCHRLGVAPPTEVDGIAFSGGRVMGEWEWARAMAAACRLCGRAALAAGLAVAAALLWWWGF